MQEWSELPQKILTKKSNIRPEHIQELSKIMQSVISSTDKTMKGARLAESGAKSRLVAVKKEPSKAIIHTRNAKYATITSRKSANSALTTLKKMTNPQLGKKYQKIYDVQITAPICAVKVAEKETQKDMMASKTARITARMTLKELQI